MPSWDYKLIKKSYVVKVRTITVIIEKDKERNKRTTVCCDRKDKMNLIYVMILIGLLTVVCGK